MLTEPNAWMTDEDWFNLGKTDAWLGRPKHPPEGDPQAASFYDLGYSEGVIGHPPSFSAHSPK